LRDLGFRSGVLKIPVFWHMGPYRLVYAYQIGYGLGNRGIMVRYPAGTKYLFRVRSVQTGSAYCSMGIGTCLFRISTGTWLLCLKLAGTTIASCRIVSNHHPTIILTHI